MEKTVDGGLRATGIVPDGSFSRGPEIYTIDTNGRPISFREGQDLIPEDQLQSERRVVDFPDLAMDLHISYDPNGRVTELVYQAQIRTVPGMPASYKFEERLLETGEVVEMTTYGNWRAKNIRSPGRLELLTFSDRLAPPPTPSTPPEAGG
ncbi:hypothetical protein A3D78_03220 [Candidatus Gottesmanbacteria bacterium RIFCSPHIGHO2_02_FULL_39_14]|uniref:Uncharacterized protein n=3 Tax=Candidatus Gottesmaniibacteriota TaxID=1752720 RepID=A0A1F5ZXU3_9BACT|nr:MAG: hypothetical protein A2153_06160 [Candidatus Gottesmanbacteria bacterium RBG_16_38_7b]OGG17278.1 MAG: hypothetical protein A3D78_03220 [Candidatus Gottesmanbacteria bacterium RIFCSPHIGHO2_02_FULL_39_14]OGG30830.1 MAG: hypothetical protein A3I51_03445 [Candidatus Gottesmanbacteria bacterium RIFCSPLOWO2_02_FULL_38_8]